MLRFGSSYEPRGGRANLEKCNKYLPRHLPHLRPLYNFQVCVCVCVCVSVCVCVCLSVFQWGRGGLVISSGFPGGSVVKNHLPMQEM